MNYENILKPLSKEQMETLSKKDLITLLRGEQSIREQAEARAKLEEEEKYLIEGRFIIIKNRLFGRSSEKSNHLNLNFSSDDTNLADTKTSDRDHQKENNKSKNPIDKLILPSEKYPNLKIIEQDITFENPPQCKLCNKEMKDSGLVETREVLTVIPKKYLIKRQNYHKYRCSCCYGSLVTTSRLPRIKSGSSYDDDLIIDVALSKYCDLIPIERYAAMAKRQGLINVPPHSLINLTHYLAKFLSSVYFLIKDEVLSSKILFADETPHRMLEGSAKTNWYLWGFSSINSCYFECHDTRSGDVAHKILSESECEFLSSDVYSGYGKAVKICNIERLEKNKKPLRSIFCNAHARRKFKEALLKFKEAEIFIEKYKKIYFLEAAKTSNYRDKMVPIFEEMKAEANRIQNSFSSKSLMYTAINYFLKNFDGLTLFLINNDLPIDNNMIERLLRNPVIGRKTWLGTHSKDGAYTNAVLFSIIESCKLNNLNPRLYFKNLIKEMHEGKEPYTPYMALQRLKVNDLS